jgi:hypothetical protein
MVYSTHNYWLLRLCLSSGILKTRKHNVRFDVFTAVTMKNAIFWDVASCRPCVNRRFGGTFRLHLQDCSLQTPAYAGSSLADFSTLKIEAIRSSETSVHTRSTRRHIPEDRKHNVSETGSVSILS